jgi:uncharacterized damage-inducible protein DinB
MSLQKLTANYAAYNAWANDTLIGYLKTRPHASWTKEVPSSFSSIARTLNHILAAQEYWMSVITGTMYIGSRYGNQNPDAQEVFDSLIAHSALTEQTVAQLSTAELETCVKVESPWFRAELPIYEYIQHMVNHGTYHRGQLVTICRNLGFTDMPMTDYNFYNVHKEDAVELAAN